MKGNMHAKTLAIVLATTTALQVTGIGSQLLNGVPFVTANAAPVSGAPTQQGTVTTSAAVTVSGPFIGPVPVQTEATATVPASVQSESDLPDTIELTLQVTTSGGATVQITTDAAVQWSYNNERTVATRATVMAPVLITCNGIPSVIDPNFSFNFNVAITGEIDIEKPILPEKDYLTVYDTTTPGAITLKWETATDDTTDASQLRYYLYESENNSYGSIADWEEHGTLLNPGGSIDIDTLDVSGLNNTSTYYFQLIVEDEQGNKTRYCTESYSKAISQIKVIRDRDFLEALIMGIHDHEAFIDESKITYNWLIDGQTVGTGKELPLLQDYVGKTINLEVKVEGYNSNNPYRASYIASVNSIDLLRENNRLTVNGFDYNGNLVSGDDFTFEYEWIVDGQVISNEKSIDLTNYYGKEIEVNVIVNGNSTFNAYGTFKNIDGVSTAISGIPQIGQTLKAKVIDNNGNDMSSALETTYSWWRMDDKNADSIGVEVEKGKAVNVGEDKEYKLTSADAGKYIRLLVRFKDADGVYREIHPVLTTDVVYWRSSGGSSSSSSSSSSSNGTAPVNTATSTTNTTTATNTAKIEKSEDGTIKLVNEAGQAAAGWQQVDGKWYLANANGIAQTGWQQTTDGTWYLLKNDGVMATGWQQTTDGTWYLLKDSGAMATGWQKVNGTWYLLKDNGAMSTGWQKTNGKWYYLYSNGSMASNTVIDGYTVDANGAWVY